MGCVFCEFAHKCKFCYKEGVGVLAENAEMRALIREHEHYFIEEDCCDGTRITKHVDVPYERWADGALIGYMGRARLDGTTSFTLIREDGRPGLTCYLSRGRYVHTLECKVAKWL